MMSVKNLRLFICSLCLLSVSLSNSANQNNSINDVEVDRILAVSQDIAYGEYLAGECASCHSATDASAGNVPVINGVSAGYLVRVLLEYQTGVRDNTTMKNVAGALGDEEIAALAHYLETLSP